MRKILPPKLPEETKKFVLDVQKLPENIKKVLNQIYEELKQDWNEMSNKEKKRVRIILIAYAMLLGGMTRIYST